MASCDGCSCSRAPRPSRVALAVILGAPTVVFGAGLMATAGYLITRAAEQPAILSLMTAIMAVRFFGDRPAPRPLLRAARFARSRPARAWAACGSASMSASSRWRRRSSTATRGDLLSRMVADVDALQNLYLRGVAPPLVAALAGALCVGAIAAFPAAALVLALGLLASGIAVPVPREPA